jgi:hypothetical protein
MAILIASAKFAIRTLFSFIACLPRFDLSISTIVPLHLTEGITSIPRNAIAIIALLRPLYAAISAEFRSREDARRAPDAVALFPLIALIEEQIERCTSKDISYTRNIECQIVRAKFRSRSRELSVPERFFSIRDERKFLTKFPECAFLFEGLLHLYNEIKTFVIRSFNSFRVLRITLLAEGWGFMRKPPGPPDTDFIRREDEGIAYPAFHFFKAEGDIFRITPQSECFRRNRIEIK